MNKVLRGTAADYEAAPREAEPAAERAAAAEEADGTAPALELRGACAEGNLAADSDPNLTCGDATPQVRARAAPILP